LHEFLYNKDPVPISLTKRLRINYTSDGRLFQMEEQTDKNSWFGTISCPSGQPQGCLSWS
jgi:hypothetical protein